MYEAIFYQWKDLVELLLGKSLEDAVQEDTLERMAKMGQAAPS